MRWTEQDLKNHRAKGVHAKGEQLPKYRNRKKTIDNVEFDSTKEANRYQNLLIRLRAKDIRKLELQRSFAIAVNGVEICVYIADFVYEFDGEQIVEDVKSKITRKNPVYRLKIKLMKAVHGITVVEV